MRRNDRIATKTGCGKPAIRLKNFALILSLALLMAVCTGFIAAPAAAQGTGDAPGADMVAMPDAPLTYRPGEVLVKFASAAAAERITATLDRLGISGVIEEIFREGEELLALLELEAGMAVEQAVRLLEPLAGIVYAEPNYITHTAYTPADPDYQPEQWGLNNYGQTIGGQAGTPGADISAQEAWDIEKGFANPVTVAIVDSGMDLSHPDLDGKIWDNAGEVAGNEDDDDGNGYIDDVSGYNWAGITQSRYYYYDSTDENYYTTAWRFGYSLTTQKLAQSIRGTGQPLTHVGLIMQKVLSPTGGITVSLRASIDGADLASLSIAPGEVSTLGGEIYRPLSSAVTLTAGTTYYLVFQTTNNNSSSYYYLYHNFVNTPPDSGTDQYDPYRDGQEYRWNGATWDSYANNDFFLHTNPNANPRDDNGHGTHVGGIVGAEEGNGQGGVGVSFGAGLMPLKVMDCTGSGYNSDITAAIYYAADNGAKAINMSLGGSSSSQAMQDAINYAHTAGVVVLAAAGNAGDTSIQYPAGYGNVIGVGATTNQDQKASFSNYNSSVDLAAPGRYIYSTMPTYAVALNSWGYAQVYDYLSGTSMSTPMAAGLAALIASREPAYTPAGVEWVMQAYAADLGTPGRDDYFGYGRIDAFASLGGMGTPVITDLAPTSGTIGSQVTINGSHFGKDRIGSSVSFGGVQATQYDAWSDTAIVCRVPAGISKQVQVTTTTPLGTSNAATFGVVPSIDSLDTTVGPVGTPVTISGAAFGSPRGTSSVWFGSVPVTEYGSWSDTTIVCSVPMGASGNVQVTVTTAGGTSNGQGFTVTPHVDGLSPTSGPIGREITIAGSAFGSTRGASIVSFGSTAAASYGSWSDIQIKCTVPSGISGQVEVKVTTAAGTSNGKTFGVVPGLGDIDPSSANIGSRVTVSGTAFGAVQGSSFVSFGGARAVIYDSWSNTAITCYVPAGISGQVEVAVTTMAGTSDAVPFTVIAPSQGYNWYLAEGSTAGGMETFILVQNPGDQEARVRLEFITEKGPQAGPTAVLPPGTRFTWKANDFITSFNVSTAVYSDQPVVVERAMYGNNRTWAHDSIAYSP